MKNVAVYENVGGALNVLVPIFNQALNNTGETADIQLFDSTLDPEDILQFHKLDLQPGFLDEINRLNEQYLLAMGNHSIPYFDPYVDALQYGGQVLMVLAKTYDISFSQLTQDAYTNLSDVPRSWSNNDTQLEYQEDLAEEWYDYFVDVYSNDLMTPSLYFTPCAVRKSRNQHLMRSMVARKKTDLLSCSA
ncbi:hypothetical protein CALVIDRAFT_248673 [Calocera viscosa TUFC12733]|uniref:Uncharacterized protein n=1 Tax=Calocera viscosa (strain TUFC12733) TaxID=1330018 RepID=A0A167JCF8_CALVF|nr:hypothetical protein CALVIDRAFT_248673 [Calocera viscosa TUFC12733]